MVWGASWDPTGRYSTMEPSGSTFRGPRKLSEVSLTVKKGLKGGEKSIKFLPNFSPFFTAKPTSERYNDPLKVIPEGSMVEYLPVGPKGAPQTIFGKKIFQA